nr:vitamin K epoxide reductase family protein [Homoserinimonas aerilata]
MLAGRGAASGTRRRPVLGAFLIIAGLVGLWAAWTLTMDKVITLVSPEAQLGCNFSVLVQCGANLSSAQGAVLGFPNPLIGLAGWAAVLVMGFALIAGAPLAQWFRVLFALGVTGAMVLVIWLIGQSVYVLGTLCPWCIVTWSVTIPTFWAAWGLLLSHSRNGVASRAGSIILGWAPLLTVLSYTVVAVLAQLRLDYLSML